MRTVTPPELPRSRRVESFPRRGRSLVPRAATALLTVAAPLVTVAACDGGALAPPGAGGRRLVVETLDRWDPAAWRPLAGPRGRGSLRLDAVSHVAGRLHLRLGPGAPDGAAVASGPLGPSAVSVELRPPRTAGGAAVVLLTVDPDNDGADAAGVEVLGDGRRTIRLVAWRDGRRTVVTSLALPFEPTEAFREYRLERSGGALVVSAANRFVGTLEAPPDGPTHVVVGGWFPIDLVGPPPSDGAAVEVEGIVLRLGGD